MCPACTTLEKIRRVRTLQIPGSLRTGWKIKLTTASNVGRLIPLGIWTIVELHVAIIVGSIPPCRALLLRLWSRLRSFSVPSQSSSLDNSLGKPASLRSKISMPFARKFRAPRGLDNHHAHTAGFWQLQPMDGGRNRSVPARVDSSRAAEGKTGRIVKTSNFTITTTTADERDQLEERPDTNYQWK